MIWLRHPIPEEGPGQVEEYIKDRDDFSFGDYTPASVFAAWMIAEIAKIPEPLQSTAEISFSTVHYYDSSRVSDAYITYLRPETDEELAYRKDAERRRDQEDERRDREQLARLQNKLGAR